MRTKLKNLKKSREIPLREGHANERDKLTFIDQQAKLWQRVPASASPGGTGIIGAPAIVSGSLGGPISLPYVRDDQEIYLMKTNFSGSFMSKWYHIIPGCQRSLLFCTEWMMLMAAKKADPESLAKIRQIAEDTSSVRITSTAEYDLMARQLNKADLCDEIVKWVD